MSGADEDARDASDAVRDGPGVIRGETGAQRLLGYTLDVGRGDDRARCTLVVDGTHANRHDRLHGGLAATLLDNAMGATASLTVDASGRRPFLTISMNVHFLAPGEIGARLTAIGRVSGGGRSLVFVEGELVDEAGTLIATGSGVFKRARSAPSEPPLDGPAGGGASTVTGVAVSGADAATVLVAPGADAAGAS